MLLVARSRLPVALYTQIADNGLERAARRLCVYLPVADRLQVCKYLWVHKVNYPAHLSLKRAA